jgi:hypothetical protein
MGQEQSSPGSVGFEPAQLGAPTESVNDEFNPQRKKSVTATPEVAPIAYKPDEVIDIYDTGVSEQLKALLATIHDEDPLEPHYNYSTESRPSLSATAQEFVPGKSFFTPKPESESTGSLLRPVISDSSISDELAPKLNASAPAFVPTQAKTSISVP